MNLRRKLHTGLAICMLTLTGWICAPLHAQQPAPAPFAKGPQPPAVAGQVRAIVMAEIKAFLPPIEEGSVAIIRLKKDTLLLATVDGQKYSAKVVRPFLVEPLNPNEIDVKEYYVRTVAPWKLKADLVIPADIYLSGAAEKVAAFDADMITVQDAAIVRSEGLCKAALDQLEADRKAKAATITDAHKAEMDSLTKQIAQLRDDAAKKEAARNAVIKANIALTRPREPVIDTSQQTVAVRSDLATPPPGTPVTTRDPAGKIIWQWSPGQGFTFNDDLDQTRKALNQAVASQKTLQATVDAELAKAYGPPGVKEKALSTVFKTHRRRILAGETISEDDMRAGYASALGEPLKAPPAAGKS